MPPPCSPPLAALAEGLVKVSLALATIFNECGKTTAWPASHFSIDSIVTEVPYFTDALWAGLVPPFSDFFNAVLSHYQIHMMHLGPESITLLSVFAFICKAMMGILPSVALLRHFFSLRLVDPTQCWVCVSFVAASETAASGIDFKARGWVPRAVAVCGCRGAQPPTIGANFACCPQFGLGPGDA